MNDLADPLRQENVHEQAQQQAAILMQALPHMLRYDDAIVVVKYGGHAKGDDKVARDFARDMVLLEQSGAAGRRSAWGHRGTIAAQMGPHLKVFQNWKLRPS